MTRDEWALFERTLSHPYGRAELVCDGYKVSCQVLPDRPLKYVILAYVNGQICGKWILEDCEERRRFMRPVTRPAYSKKHREGMRKIGKKCLATIGWDPDRTITYYKPGWPSAAALRRHLAKHNKDIQLASPRPEAAAETEAA